MSLQTTYISGSVSSARKIREQQNINKPTRGSHQLDIIGRTSFPITAYHGNMVPAVLFIFFYIIQSKKLQGQYSSFIGSPERK